MDFELIETERLLLQGISPALMTFIFEHHSRDKIMHILGHRSEKEYETEFFKQKNGYSTYNRSFLTFLLQEKQSGKIIGRCGLHNWNADHHRAEVGYHMTDESFRKRGLMTEAFGAVIDYGFNTLNLHRMEALVGANNIPSLRLMEKYGFVQEGVLREHWLTDGEFEDSVMFSKLQKELADGE